MIKMLSLLKRKPGLSRDDFQDHYESACVSFMLSQRSGLSRYVRYHVRSCDQAGPFDEFPFDTFTDCGYEEKGAADAALEAFVGKAALRTPIDEVGDQTDGASIMDRSGSRLFAVSERVLQGEASGEGDVSIFILVAKPSGMTRYDASARMEREHWPQLRGLCGISDFVLLRDAFPVADRALSYDQIIQVASPIPRGLGKWTASLKACGYQVSVAETQRFETSRTDRLARDQISGGGRAAE